MPRIPSVHKLQPPGRPDFYQLELDGKRYYLGTHRIRAEAKAAELKRRHYGVMPTDAPQSVAELVALWNHQRPGREYAVARWTKFRGPVSLDEIKADHFDGYMRALIKHGYSDWVIRESITYAHAVCRWAYDREWLDRVPRKPKTPTPIRRPRDVAPELVAKLLGLVHERPRRLLTFIAVTGCRPGEACKLYWENYGSRPNRGDPPGAQDLRQDRPGPHAVPSGGAHRRAAGPAAAQRARVPQPQRQAVHHRGHSFDPVPRRKEARHRVHHLPASTYVRPGRRGRGHGR